MGESHTQERLCSACTCNLENCTQSTHTRDQDILPDILVEGKWFFSPTEHPLSSKSTLVLDLKFSLFTLRNKATKAGTGAVTFFQKVHVYLKGSFWCLKDIST